MFPRTAVILLVAGMLVTSARAQYFNIDIDDPYSPPPLGGGPPSDSFGAAANQPGYWNSVRIQNQAPVGLIDIHGVATAAEMSVVANDNLSGMSYLFTGNTGDFALLLNDARQVGTVDQGGFQTYTFSGLANGTYQVYTYAVMPMGLVSETPVFVAGSTSTNPQIVTGPMPGDAFALGITHSLHNVEVTNGGLVVSVTIPPGVMNGGWINGFQITPEPNSLLLVSIGALVGLRRRRS